MKILLVAKLSDNSLNCILEPLLQLSYIEQIFVLRDKSGNNLSSKVSYISYSEFNISNKTRHIIKIFKGIRACKEYKVDAIIGVLLYPHGYIGRLISYITKLPYIHVTIAGQREFWVLGKYIEKLNYLFFKNSFKITVTGTKTRKYLMNYGYNPDKIVVLPNVIDMSKFENYDKKREFDLLSFSRMDKNKNISLLLNAIAKVKDKVKIKTLIAGDGPEYKKLTNEAKSLDLNDEVIFSGWIDESRKNEIFNNSKIFVLCSLGEGFPLSMIEAMSCGCVPIVTDVGDVSDVIENGRNGFLIKNYQNEKELAEIIEKLLNDPERLNKIYTHTQKIHEKLSYELASNVWDDILGNK